MDLDTLRQQISAYLKFTLPEEPVPFTLHERVPEGGYSRTLITYRGDEGDRIPAYLLLPDTGQALPGVIVHHQHHGQRHLGKSEVCGLAGDPLQAFGPALARRGVAVLAPDSICFEDRRRSGKGTEPHDRDTGEHYDELCYRLLRGDTLMRKLLSDSARAISVLQAHPRIAPGRIGIMGHSYGGSTTLFHSGLDERIRFACASGAACTYRHRMAQHTGIEMSQVIPGFASRYDFPSLLACCAPRPLLLVSATDDQHSQDADTIVALARQRCAAAGVTTQIEHHRYQGGHALTMERFQDIVTWVVGQAL